MKSSDATMRADFAWFVESQSGAMLRLAHVMMGQSEAAEDLVQDTLLAVFRHWDRVANARNRDAYVRRMLTNGYLSMARRRRFEERPLEDSLAARNSGTATVEDHDALWRALSQISPRQQAVVVLRYYEDLDDSRSARFCTVGGRPFAVWRRVHWPRCEPANSCRRVRMRPPDRRIDDGRPGNSPAVGAPSARCQCSTRAAP